MDIAKLSMNMSSAKVMTEVSMRMFKMSLDQMRDVENMMKSMDAATATIAAASVPINYDPTVGQHLDISV